MTRDELKSYIKRQFGFPLVSVEITDAQLDDAINDSIIIMKSYYQVYRYATIDVPGGRGVIDLLNKYNLDVIEVTDVFKVTQSNGAGTDDIFNNNVVAGSSVLGYASIASNLEYCNALRYGNRHRVFSAYAKANREQFYGRLADIAQERALGNVGYDISWKYEKDKLYIDTGTSPATTVTIEYISNIRDVDDIDDGDEDEQLYLSYLKQLSYANASLISSRILSKTSINSSPTNVDGKYMAQNATNIIKEVKQELKSHPRFYITL